MKKHNEKLINQPYILKIIYNLWCKLQLSSVPLIMMMLVISINLAFTKHKGQVTQSDKANSSLNSSIDLEEIKSVSIGENHEILVNGKPFFPIMSWYQSVSNYNLLKSLGMNTHAGSNNTDAAKNIGCYSIPFYNTTMKENGHILGWVYDDEPDMPSGKGINAKPRQSPQIAAEKCSIIRANYPDRLIFMTFTGDFTDEQSAYNNTYPKDVRQTLYPQFISSADVVGFDIYPIYGTGYPAHLDWVGSGVAQLRDMAGPKPVYAWIETNKGSRWMTYSKQPDVLPIHTRNEVWQAITKGATAIGYFTHAYKPEFIEFAPTLEMQAELSRLNTQIARLAPAILAAPAKINISMTLGEGLNCNIKTTNINDTIYIFSLNMDLGEGAETAQQFDPIYPRSGTAVFSVEGLIAGTEIEVIDEERTIIAQDGKFSDDFAPLAEHIYMIKAEGIDVGSGVVNINLSTNLELSQNYPNPFSSNTEITFNASEAGHYSLKIYDFIGRETAVLFNGIKPVGKHAVEWDGTNSARQQVSNGIYFYKLTADNLTQVKKMIKSN